MAVKEVIGIGEEYNRLFRFKHDPVVAGEWRGVIYPSNEYCVWNAIWKRRTPPKPIRVCIDIK